MDEYDETNEQLEVLRKTMAAIRGHLEILDHGPAFAIVTDEGIEGDATGYVIQPLNPENVYVVGVSVPEDLEPGASWTMGTPSDENVWTYFDLEGVTA